MNVLSLLSSRPRVSMTVAGTASELIYLLAFVRPFPLLRYANEPYQDMGQISNHSPVQFVIFLGAFALLFLLLGAVWFVVRDQSDRQTLRLILGLGAIFGLTMSFAYPVTANDIFGYIAQSLIMVQYHQNPIAVPPSAFPHDPLMSLTGGWAGYTAAYGPIGLVIDALPAFIAHRNLLENLLLLKLMFSTMTVLCAYFVHEILQRIAPRQALSGALLVAWNPLILFETSANGHNDILMMALTVFALLLMVEGSWTAGPGVLMAAALVKYAALVLLPLMLVYAVTRMESRRQQSIYLAKTGCLVVLVAIVAYRPFWIGFRTFSRPLLEAQLYLYSFSSVLHNVLPGTISLGAATIVGRIIFIPIYLYALWLSARSVSGLVEACFLATFSFLGLAVTNIKYWYLVWPSILGAAVPSTPTRLAILTMGAGTELAAALNVYVWTWVGVTSANFAPINNVSYAAIFVVPAAVVVFMRARSTGGSWNRNEVQRTESRCDTAEPNSRAGPR